MQFELSPYFKTNLFLDIICLSFVLQKKYLPERNERLKPRDVMLGNSLYFSALTSHDSKIRGLDHL